MYAGASGIVCGPPCLCARVHTATSRSIASTGSDVKALARKVLSHSWQWWSWWQWWQSGWAGCRWWKRQWCGSSWKTTQPTLEYLPWKSSLNVIIDEHNADDDYEDGLVGKILMRIPTETRCEAEFQQRPLRLPNHLEEGEKARKSLEKLAQVCNFWQSFGKAAKAEENLGFPNIRSGWRCEND